MIAIYQISTPLVRNVSRQFSAQNCFSWWKTRFSHLFSTLWQHVEGIYVLSHLSTQYIHDERQIVTY